MDIEPEMNRNIYDMKLTEIISFVLDSWEVAVVLEVIAFNLKKLAGL